MMQVIINLVDNAIKYTPPLSIISIKAKRFGDQAVISVSDNGSGIPDDQKEELFRMFYTVNHSVGGRQEGYGAWPYALPGHCRRPWKQNQGI